MSDDLSMERAIRNELIVRGRNTKTKNGIKRFFHNNKKIKAAPLNFICECSAADCQKHIQLSINAYEKTHQRNDWFTIVKGHETPAVEKVVADEGDFTVVEKFPLNP
jgi:hypothetical protein